MVFLKTDTGEYRELLAPSIITVGRSTTNDIRPISQSVSKTHAKITVNKIPQTGKVEAWLEDMGSSNGTFAGETPLEIERIRGKIKLYFGFYIRFGHSPNYFQYLETIPADAEVLRPEIIVSPSKDFQQEAMDFSSNKQPPTQQAPASSQDYGHPRLSSQPSSRPQSPGNVQFNEYQHQSMNEQNIPSNSRSGRYDDRQPSQSYESTGANGNSNNQTYSNHASNGMIMPTGSPSRGQQQQQHYPSTFSDPNYGNNNPEDDDPQNMQISVNYPTSNNQSAQHPVSIFIDPATSRTGGNRSHGSLSRSRGGSGGYRGPVSPIPEANQEFSPTYSPGGAGAGAAAGRLSMSDDYDSSGGGYNITRRSQRQPGGTDRVEFAESKDNYYYNTTAVAAGVGAGDTTRDNYHPYEGANSAMNNMTTVGKGMGMTMSKPKPVSQAVGELGRLSRQSTAMRSSKLGKPTYSSGSSHSHSNTRDAQGGAINSQYYQNKINEMNQPKGILRTSKQVDFQAKLGDNGAIMDAILPNQAALVRRSWPEALRPPSSELIAKFVDYILAQEVGTTEKEYALYKDIYLGKHKPEVVRDAAEEGVPNLDHEPILAKLQMNPVKCDMPVVMPDHVLSEAVAESILEVDSTATGLLGKVITELNDLMRQCLLGSKIDTDLGYETSADFDFALQGMITSIVKSAIANLMSAQQSNVLTALEDFRGQMDVKSNAGLLIQQGIDSLSRANSFMQGTYLQEETVGLKTEHIYEIVALSLSGILNKLDACNVAIWSIGQRADEVTMEHVVNKSGGFLKASLALELEELRKMKKESDLTPLVDRIRQQESNLVERKILRFHKVFEILLEFNLKSAFCAWRSNTRAIKRQELNLLDLQDRCEVTTKRAHFKEWRKTYIRMHNFNKALRRFARIVGSKADFQLRRYWKRWEQLMQQSRHSAESGAEIAKLRNQIVNMKATLHDLTNKDEVAASLAAERALNRELSTMNQELRHSLQSTQERLLEIGGAPAGKRKDLVYHHLIGKEEELAAAVRENKFLHSELDHLRILAARRVPPSAGKQQQLPQGRARQFIPSTTSTLPVAGTAGRSHPGVGGRANSNNNNNSNNNDGSSSHRPGAYARRGGGASAEKYDPSRYKSVVDRPNDVAFMMSKDEAKVVILSEVRRLRDSHAAVKESRDALNNKMIEETNRNVQLTMSVQSLQSRLTAMERSANAMRELLRQKLGDVGIIHFIEALENLGAGSNCLLEVPMSDTATVAHGTGVADNKIGYSYETKHPEMSSSGDGAYASSVNAARDDALKQLGLPDPSGTVRNNWKDGSGGGGNSGGSAVGRNIINPDDPAHAYGRAIDSALYK